MLPMAPNALHSLAPLLRPGAHSSKLVSNLSTCFSSSRFSRCGTYCPRPTLDSRCSSAVADLFAAPGCSRCGSTG